MLLFLSMLGSDTDKDKFVRIYEKYRYFLWYLANERLQDVHLAEDAVQETFLALTRHMDKVGEVESVATRNFLATIVKGKAVDILRRRHDHAEVEFAETAGHVGTNTESRPSVVGTTDACMDDAADALLADGSQGDPLDACLVQENYEQILKCVRELDESYRVVFEYKYLHELSDREIADLLGITPKNVNVRIFRARKKLQKMLMNDHG